MRNKDIIKQYVNTGRAIPKHQFDRLNNSLLKSYFRARLKAMIITDEDDVSEENDLYYAGYLYKWYEIIKLDSISFNNFVERFYYVCEDYLIDFDNEETTFELGGYIPTFIMKIISIEDINDEYIKLLLNNKKIYDNLGYEHMENMLMRANNPLNLQSLFGLKISKFKKRMNKYDHDAKDMLKYSNNPGEIQKLLSIDLENFSEDEIKYMIFHSNVPAKIFDLFKPKSIESLKSIKNNDIFYINHNSRNKSEIYALMKQYNIEALI